VSVVALLEFQLEQLVLLPFPLELPLVLEQFLLLEHSLPLAQL
jgi:hypothetical protein